MKTIILLASCFVATTQLNAQAWDRIFPKNDKVAGHIDLYDRTELIPFDKMNPSWGKHTVGDTSKTATN